MPARHDILCGALDFLWKPWGSIEAWEQPITRVLRHQGVTSFLATDHPHLFETGGENYHTDFNGWDYLRGHEGDPWRTYRDPSWVGAPARPAVGGGWFFEKIFGADVIDRGYDRSRTFFRAEEDYPGPRTMTEAARFLTDATPHHDRWFLFVDEFDPHEPFDTPEPWVDRYQDGPWDDDWIIWPPYANGAVSAGILTEAEGRHIRGNYGAKLSMIDEWFGRILDAFDQQRLWDDTALILCTDHGHYLGDERAGKDIWGKPNVPQYEPLGHTPLLIHWPGVEGGGTCDALTTNVDLFATIADVVRHRGRSPHPRGLAGPVARRHDRPGPRLGHRRRLGQLGPGHRRGDQVRPGPRRGQLPALGLVQPVVDHAHPHRRRGGAAGAGSAGVAGHHARHRRPGAAPALRGRAIRCRSGPWATRSTSTTSTGSMSTRTSRRTGRGACRAATWPSSCAPRCVELEAPAEQLQRLGLT